MRVTGNRIIMPLSNCNKKREEYMRVWNPDPQSPLCKQDTPKQCVSSTRLAISQSVTYPRISPIALCRKMRIFNFSVLSDYEILHFSKHPGDASRIGAQTLFPVELASASTTWESKESGDTWWLREKHVLSFRLSREVELPQHCLWRRRPRKSRESACNP